MASHSRNRVNTDGKATKRMTRDEAIIELGAWLQTPPGRYLVAWEHAHLDDAVADAFGFHALQLGLPEVDALRANRMPHRWVATDALQPPVQGRTGPTMAPPVAAPGVLHCDFDALPFPSHSLDLVVMPHTLELARDPHLTLREVERVLMPEGRLVITGFNPASLWGLRQRGGRAVRGLGLARNSHLYLPRSGEFIGYWRLRDWLRLLGFEVDTGRFGAYRPPCRTERWLTRYRWMDRIGDRWWPVLGAVYAIGAVKHVRGMRLVGMAKREVRRPRAAPAVVAQRQRQLTEIDP